VTLESAGSELSVRPRSLTSLPLSTLAPLIQAKEVSPVELVECFLQRIDALDPQLNGFVTVLHDQALTEARSAEREIVLGRYRGPLHGIPIGHKDIIETRGVRTTAQSRILHDYVPEVDATVVDRLRAAGSVLIGKLATAEFACGETSAWGVPSNPWDTSRTTGGSSAGSAASVSAGLCAAATGTDTGGSVRSPASFCGVVGFKPTYGLVSRKGVLPVSWSLDHVGPITRTVGDAALMLAAMMGFDPGDHASVDTTSMNDLDALVSVAASERRGADLHGVRLGVPDAFFSEGVDPEVAEIVSKAIEVLGSLGADVRAVNLPASKFATCAQRGIMLPEAATAHLRWLTSNMNEYAPSTRVRLQVGACLGGTHYLHAQRLRRLVTSELAEVFKSVEALAWPTTRCVAHRNNQPKVSPSHHSKLANLAGLPAVSVPCGFTNEGLPVGLQICGRAFEDATVLKVASAYERATEWALRLPPLTSSHDSAPPIPDEPLKGEPATDICSDAADLVRLTLRGLGLPFIDSEVEQIARTVITLKDQMASASEEVGLAPEPMVFGVHAVPSHRAAR